MNIVEICTVKYPGQVEARNITFRKPDDEILLDLWRVPEVERPDEVDLLAEASQWERLYALFRLKQDGLYLIELLLNEKAKDKGYNNAISCASYANSTNAEWKAEAEVFVVWRDAIWTYAYAQFEAAQQGGAIPSAEELISGSPQLIWP